MDQHKGLTEEAQEFLAEHVEQVPHGHCPHCGEPLGLTFKREEHASYFGMFEDEYPLWSYTLRNGSTVREIVQAEPWSSGPVFFLCLVMEDDTRLGEWSEE